MATLLLHPTLHGIAKRLSLANSFNDAFLGNAEKILNMNQHLEKLDSPDSDQNRAPRPFVPMAGLLCLLAVISCAAHREHGSMPQLGSERSAGKKVDKEKRILEEIIGGPLIVTYPEDSTRSKIKTTPQG